MKIQGRGYALTWNTQVNYAQPWTVAGLNTYSWFSAAGWDNPPVIPGTCNATVKTNCTSSTLAYQPLLVHSLCQHESIDGEFDGDDEDNSTQPMIVTTEYVFPGPDLGMFDVGYALYQAYED